MYWKKEWTIPAVTGVISFGVGAVVGYAATLYKYKKIEEAVDEIESNTSELENDIAKIHHRLDDRTNHINEALEYAWNIVSKFEPNAPEIESIEEELPTLHVDLDHPSISGMPMVTQSVFSDDEDDDDWDYDLEFAQRESRTSRDIPYVIHADEYSDGEEGYSQSTLTWYAGDSILTDEEDVPVYQPERVVGELKFGHGSKDPSICFVRNDRLQADYEVLIDHGYFQVEVLGEEIENALNREKAQPLKFRPSD